MTPMKVSIRGTGVYAPGEPIGHEELKKLAGIDFDSEKLTLKLGIENRHIAKLRGIDETTADFTYAAAVDALGDASVSPDEIDLIIVATDTPEFITPATAIVLQGRLQNGNKHTQSFDLGTSCAGFVTALDTGARIVATNPAIRKALIVGVYNMPAYIRPGDSFGFSIFADGAGAVVLAREEEGSSEYLHGAFVTDGTQWDYVGVYTGGTRNPVTRDRLESGEYGFQLLKPLPGNRNVELWPPLAERLLSEAGKTPADLDHILFTQINRSVILTVMDILGLPVEKTTTVMGRYGYTGSACIPMAFHHAVKEGRIRRGDTVALVASGAGLAVGSCLFTY